VAKKAVGGALPTGRLGRALRLGRLAALVSLGAARLGGSASGAARRLALLTSSGVRFSFGGLTRVLARRLVPPLSTEAVRAEAEGIALALRERDIAPDKLGIDGIPGSGKSTLARVLAEELDMKWRSLDYLDPGDPRNIEEGRTIYEHHRLLRTHDVDAFDAIVYVNENVARAKARVRRRRRGQILSVILEYRKLKKVGDLAFEVCGGETIAIPTRPGQVDDVVRKTRSQDDVAGRGGESRLVLKIRPPEGFRAAENIASALAAAGLDAPGPVESGLRGKSKEKLLFLLAFGKRRHGFVAYLRPLARYVALLGRMVALFGTAGRRAGAALCERDSADNGSVESTASSERRGPEGRV
jgi:hypothetical protein